MFNHFDNVHESMCSVPRMCTTWAIKTVPSDYAVYAVSAHYNCTCNIVSCRYVIHSIKQKPENYT